MHFPDNIEKMKLYFVGIKGTGMAALAEICTFRGAKVTGSDVEEKFYTDEVLKNLGITPLVFDKNNITDDIDLVIHSAAYGVDSHPELIEAKKRGIPLKLYAQALGDISQSSYSCAIAGVHGKTSTTGITGTLVKAFDLPAQVLAGSIISSFTDSHDVSSCTLNLGEEFFIAETCEYKRHFMCFAPKKIILTSVESDHQDYFPTFEDIQKAFIDFAALLPEDGEIFYCADDEGARNTIELIKKANTDITCISYGKNATGDYKITMGEVKEGKQFFNIALFEKEFPEGFYLHVPGEHNVLNAVASGALVLSLCDQNNKQLTLKEKYNKLHLGFASFKGSKRRAEIIGSVTKDSKTVLIMDDYAHHPTALKTTLKGLRKFYPNYYIIADFMSHTYTRTHALLEEFADSFADADEVLMHKIYASAREQYNGTVTGRSLFEHTTKNHSNVKYFEEFTETTDYLLNSILHSKKNVLFVTLGAGDNWQIGKDLLKKLESTND